MALTNSCSGSQSRSDAEARDEMVTSYVTWWGGIHVFPTFFEAGQFTIDLLDDGIGLIFVQTPNVVYEVVP